MKNCVLCEIVTGEAPASVLYVADAVRKSGLRCEGIDLFLADGEPQQEVLHLHMHVIPRFQRDSFRTPSDHGPRQSRKELDRTVAKVRGATN